MMKNTEQDISMVNNKELSMPDSIRYKTRAFNTMNAIIILSLRKIFSIIFLTDLLFASV